MAWTAHTLNTECHLLVPGQSNTHTEFSLDSSWSHDLCVWINLGPLELNQITLNLIEPAVLINIYNLYCDQYNVTAGAVLPVLGPSHLWAAAIGACVTVVLPRVSSRWQHGVESDPDLSFNQPVIKKQKKKRLLFCRVQKQ